MRYVYLSIVRRLYAVRMGAHDADTRPSNLMPLSAKGTDGTGMSVPVRPYGDGNTNAYTALFRVRAAFRMEFLQENWAASNKYH